MIRKFKKWMAVFSCMAFLAVSPMSVSAAPYAAAACSHPEIVVLESSEPDYVSASDDYHTVSCTRKVKCKDCGNVFYETITYQALHFWYMYDNLGHHGTLEDGEHTYRLHCKDCSGTRIVYLVCTGKIHSVPW